MLSVITQKRELEFVLLWYIYNYFYDPQKARKESFPLSTFYSTSQHLLPQRMFLEITVLERNYKFL